MSSTVTATNHPDVYADPFPPGLQIVTGQAHTILTNSKVVAAATAGQHVLKITPPNRYGTDREFGVWYGHLPLEVTDNITTAEVTDVPATGPILSLVARHNPDVLLIDHASKLTGYRDRQLGDGWHRIEADLYQTLKYLSVIRDMPVVVGLMAHPDNPRTPIGGLTPNHDSDSILSATWVGYGSRLRVEAVKSRYPLRAMAVEMHTADNGRGRPLVRL